VYSLFILIIIYAYIIVYHIISYYITVQYSIMRGGGSLAPTTLVDGRFVVEVPESGCTVQDAVAWRSAYGVALHVSLLDSMTHEAPMVYLVSPEATSWSTSALRAPQQTICLAVSRPLNTSLSFALSLFAVYTFCTT